MLTDTAAYFKSVNAYRYGDADGFVRYLAIAASQAAAAAETSAEILGALPSAWRDQARPRGGSTDAKMIGLLVANPVIDVAGVQRLTGASYNAAADSCGRLESAGVLTRLTNSARDRAWMATDVLDEIDGLNVRIGIRRAVEQG